MEKSDQRYLFECENCGERFTFGSNSNVEIKYGVQFKTKDGRSIFLTYYDCPFCDRRHYVQVDDSSSLKKKREVASMFRKLAKKRLNFIDIPQTQNKKFQKLNNSLEDYRFELKKELNGQTLIRSDGKEVKVNFSM